MDVSTTDFLKMWLKSFEIFLTVLYLYDVLPGYNSKL